MNFPKELKYTSDHEWVKIKGNIAVIGVTDHAQSELGDVVFIDIPDDLEVLSRGDTIGTIEAVKTVADLFAPVSGEVIEVNRDLNDEPETVNKDPYGKGWMVKIDMSDTSELDDLMDVDTYKDSIGQ